MALTWLTKTKQYFTTKVFSEDRFRTKDKPTEAEYSNLFQSIVFKVHDLATWLLAGVVRKALRLDVLFGKDDKTTNLSGYSHTEPLYVPPSLFREFITPSGTILSWIPYRNLKTGVPLINNTGHITDPAFIALMDLLLPSFSSNPHTSFIQHFWYDSSIINYLEENYLSPRYKICDGTMKTFTNPYTGLPETVPVPNLRERVVRGASNTPANPLYPNQFLLDIGGMDFQNLSHRHIVTQSELSAGIIPDTITFVLTVGQLPSHTHNYNLTTIPVINSANVSPLVTGTTVVTPPINTGLTPSTTSPAGGNNPVAITPTLTFNDIYTTTEVPIGAFVDFTNVDNRQKFINTFFIFVLY